MGIIITFNIIMSSIKDFELGKVIGEGA